MAWLRWLCLMALAMASLPAWALSTEQVLKLKKAGVSEAVIQKIIDAEMAQAGGASTGRYVVRQSGGREVIVYQAGSGASQEEYPLEMDPAWQGSRDVRAILGHGGKSDVIASKSAPRAQALAGARGAEAPAGGGRYTLLLESMRERASADKRAKELTGDGIAARVESVDLGGQGRWFRVLHGRFAGREQAEAMGEKLRQAGAVGSYTVLAR